jgi:CubicO group peptidase (beta-lactamase class C family)
MTRLLPALLMLWCAAGAQTPAAGVESALRVYDAWVEATAARREQPGVSIGIVHDQKLVWAKGYGFADVANKQPAAPRTLYRIASISKLFTATAMMQLRDAGKLALDDPVARHLEWFRIQNRHPHGPAITLRHLLTHTSGLPRESAMPYWTTKRFPGREEMIRLLATQETIYAAETQVKYSNLALALAGEVVERAAAAPYDRVVEERILRPLGMTSTQVRPQPSMPELATGYGRRVPGQAREPEEFSDTGGIAPAANLASSVEDLAKFVMLQFRDAPASGAQVLKGSTLREMHRVHWLAEDWRSGRGLGFQVRRVGDQVRVGHGGSLGGYRTQLEFVPATKIGVIVLTNSNDGEPGLYLDSAFAIVAPALVKAAAKPPETKKADPAWDKYVGTYYWKSTEDQVMVLDGELFLLQPEAENPWEAKVRLEPAGEHAFRMHGGSAAGELLKFEVDASGRVTRYVAPGSYRLRKGVVE